MQAKKINVIFKRVKQHFMPKGLAGEVFLLHKKALTVRNEFLTHRCFMTASTFDDSLIFSSSNEDELLTNPTDNCWFTCKSCGWGRCIWGWSFTVCRGRDIWELWKKWMNENSKTSLTKKIQETRSSRSWRLNLDNLWEWKWPVKDSYSWPLD